VVVKPRNDPGKTTEHSSLPPLKGYEALTPNDLEQLGPDGQAAKESLPEDLDGAPAGLRRDGARFYCYRSGMYLPVGYKPEDPNDLVDGWPRVLIRADGVKFVRISGRPYTRGDFTSPGKPATKEKENPLQPHKVEVSGFYIQQTEVTNREIEDFEDEIASDSLAEWKKAVKVWTNDFNIPPEAVRNLPAVSINRMTAQSFAAARMGRLPTEAEWEFAARSRGQDCRWAGKNQVARKGPPRAHVFSPENAGQPGPVPVKSYAGEDETEQNVFDMTGNVREWCRDVYEPYSKIINKHKNADPAGADGPLHDPCECREPTPGEPKVRYVVRGGSFLTSLDDAKTFQRVGVEADAQPNDLGFRVVIECPPEFSVAAH
jgi:serine/threonine-protein kinase